MAKPPLPVDFRTLIEQSVKRQGIDERAVDIILDAYTNGPLGQIVSLALAAGVDPPSGKSVLVLYSGWDSAADKSNEVLAQAYVQENSDAYSLNQTAAFQYLTSSDEKIVLEHAVAALKAELTSAGIVMTAKQEWAMQEPIWRAISPELVNQSPATELVTFVDGAQPLSVFGANEAPAVMNSDISIVNGNDIAPLRGSSDPFSALKGTQAADSTLRFFQDETTKAIEYVPPGEPVRPGLISLADLLASKPTASSPGDQALMVQEGTQQLVDAATAADADFTGFNGSYEADFSSTRSYAWVDGIGTLSRVLAAYGYAALAFDVTASSARAITQVRAGDYDGAAQTMLDMGARVAGGIEGAELGAATGAEFGLAVGGPVGAAAGALIGGIAGGIGGAYLGQEAIRAIEQAAADALKSLVNDITGDTPHNPEPVDDAEDAMGYANVQISPLVLDLTGNGVNLTGLTAASPYFDLTNDGFARRTGWVGAGTGILALDPDDSNITNITQLFGNATTDGFTMLRKLDSNGDGKIDAKDTYFSSLRVWVDANGDAKTGQGELFTLAQLGITSINLNAAKVNQTVEGNRISSVSSYTLADGSTRTIEDVWFNNSASDTRPVEDVPASPDASLLPQLAGSGIMRDLRASMTQDAALMQQVQSLTQQASDVNPASLEAIVQSVLYEWAGVSGVAPGARGGYIDARRLEFIEKYLGQAFDSENDGTVPAFRASAYVQKAWNEVFDASLARLVLQVPALAAIVPGFVYDAKSDTVSSTKAMEDVIADAFARIGDLSTGNLAAWDLVLRMADAQRIDAGMSIDAFYKIVANAAPDGVASVASAIAQGLAVTVGSDGRIVETGSAIGDDFYAGHGVSVLNGADGGNNFAEILPKNDVFHYSAGDGNVEIVELDADAVAPTNTLVFGAGIDAADITVSTGSGSSIVLTYKYGGKITIDQMAYSANDGVQSVVFADGTVWSRAQILQLAAPASSGGMTSSYLNGTTGDDVLDGQGGNDYATGNGGNDTFVYNSGYGNLEISEKYLAGQSPILQLGAGITAASLHVAASASGKSLVLTDGVTGDSITIDYMLSDGYGVEAVRFADGSTMTRAQLLAREMSGSTANESLYGSAGADRIDGGGGTDILVGNGGNDTFVFNAGYGQLEINEQDFSATAANVLQLGSGISAASVIVKASGNDIILTDGISGDRVRLDGMVAWNYDGVQSIRFADGTVWSAADVGLRARQINGTTAADTVYGTASGADIIDGKGGGDLVYGNGGSDTFVFNAGYGRLEVSENYDASTQAPVLVLGSGITASGFHVVSDGSALVLYTGATNDRIVFDSMWSNAGAGVASVQLADGSVYTRGDLMLMEMTGSTASDTLYGTAGADRLDGKGGKGGKDVIVSYGGNDTYVYESGYGQLEIRGSYATGQVPVLQLGTGIQASTLRVTSDGYSLFLSDGVADDNVTLTGMWSYLNEGVASVAFADGSTLSRAQLVLAEMTGATGNDTIYGSSGDDRLDGKGGADLVYGRGGNDTFVFAGGYGHLTIDSSFNANQSPVLEFAAGINADDIHVTTDGSSLILTDGISGDQVKLLDEWSYLDEGVATVRFADGTTLSRAQLVNLEMLGTSANDSIRGTSGDNLIDGGGGNDTVTGYGGNDTFVFKRGYGYLEINESRSSTQAPMIQLGEGITTSDLHVSLSPAASSLVLTDGVAGDEIYIDYGVSSPGDSGVTSVRFADGTVWTQAQLLDMAHHVTGTTGNDTITGSTTADTFDGKGGNDSFNGNGGSDTYVFNAGYGNLTINSTFSGTTAPVLQLGSGITADMLHVSTNGTNLYLTDGIAGDKINLQYEWEYTGDGVAAVTLADGTTLTRAQLLTMERTGTAGADTLYGNSGADTFDGLGGNDSINGYGGNDTIVYNQGYGKLTVYENYGSGQMPVLQLGAGITADNLHVTYGNSGYDLILTDGVSGDQVVLQDAWSNPGSYGVGQVRFADGSTLSSAQLITLAHQISGTTGNDTFSGTSGADLLDGKGGHDYVTGNGGNDTFVFNAGYGYLEISESYSSTQSPVLQLGAGITTANLHVGLSPGGTSLVLTDGVSGDEVYIDSEVSNTGYGVASVQFADGTVWTQAQLLSLARTIQGTTGNDTITGSTGADIFDGKGGNDSFNGNGGSDTYVFNAGYGNLTINSTFSGTVTPVLQLGAGITADMLHVSTGGTHLYLTDGVAGDKITLLYEWEYANDGVALVTLADGTTLTRAQLVAMERTGTAGADTLYGNSGADTFDGLGGNDSINGYGGNDTIVYNQGYGKLTVYENYSSGQVPVLQLGAGITADNLHVTYGNSGYDLILTDGVSGDQVVLQDAWSNPGSYGVGQVRFADGSTLSSAQLITLAHQINGTTGNDTFSGTSGADLLDGKGGHDYVTGNGGNDTFVFNAGYGYLEISESHSSTQSPVLQLGAGITAANLHVGLSPGGSSLVLTDGIVGDEVYIDTEVTTPSGYGVNTVQFADGTVWTQAQLLDMAHHVTGTAGNDTITGSTTADTFDGKGGNDSFNGNGGSDTYVFNAGYGNLTINSTFSGTTAPVLQLGSGITADMLHVSTNGTNLYLTDGIAGDKINLQYEWEYTGDGVAAVTLADGTTFTRAQLLTMERTGTTGADTLYGNSGADTFDGLGGNDSINGYGGNDTIVYNQGYGKLTVYENYSSGQVPVLQLGEGITADNLHVTYSSSGYDLLLSDGLSGDQIVLQNAWSSPGSYGVGQVRFADGSTLSSAQLITLAHQINGTTGNDTFSGTSGADLLDGKGGHDYVTGNGGNDTFVFNAGYGYLEISESHSSTQSPVLQLGAGITADNLHVGLSPGGSSLVLTDGIAGDEVYIDTEVTTPSGYGVNTVQFADGTMWTQAQLLDMAHHVTGTTGNDTITGSTTADTFDGKGGNDSFTGNGGSDTYVFNAGYGSLTIYDSFSSSAAPVLKLGDGITASSLTVSKSGSNLVLGDGIAGDKVTLQNMASYTGYGVATVVLADNTTYTRAQLLQMATTPATGAASTATPHVDALIHAMASFSAHGTDGMSSGPLPPHAANDAMLLAASGG